MTAMIHHHTITVTTYTNELAMVAHSEASKIFPDVSPIAVSQFNGYRSFFIPPDGSKWGWPEDLEADARRFQFIGWLDGQADEDGGNAYEWFEARYGREAEYDGEVRAEVVNGSHTTERIGADGRTHERERLMGLLAERTICEQCDQVRLFQKDGVPCLWCTVARLEAQVVRMGATEYEFLGDGEDGEMWFAQGHVPLAVMAAKVVEWEKDVGGDTTITAGENIDPTSLSHYHVINDPDNEERYKIVPGTHPGARPMTSIRRR